MQNSNSSSFTPPRWLRDFKRFIPLKNHFVLTGNVRDLQPCEITPGTVTSQPTVEVLKETFYAEGYAGVLLWQPLTGFRWLSPMTGDSKEERARQMSRLGLDAEEQRSDSSTETLGRFPEHLAALQGEPVAQIVDFAARLTANPGNLAPVEHQLFTRALICAGNAKPRPFGPGGRPYFNSVVWITEKEGDLPDWFVVGNQRLRSIPLSRPDTAIRETLASSLLRILPEYAAASPEDIQHAANAFVDATEGLLLADMNAIVQLARMESVPLTEISDAVRRYKVGVTEDPWRRLNREKIRNAQEFVRRRIKGQEHAVEHMLDIVKRAVTGIGGAKRGNRPRGVAFLAGPTGVGKTELAKTITDLLFGDESAYIRFDMSEFSVEHADQRLLGAPPGYVGYDVGGELTNAIREKPFSVVLFDEIEKAHPRILDKFLQILDDGVLTSGRGDRVYFSEALIVFTSNLGAADAHADAAPTPSETFEEVQAKTLTAIRRYFREVLNRPELLNRIGENIIVFDFIRPDVAAEIYGQMLANALAGLAQQGYCISVSPEAEQSLSSVCLRDLRHGGAASAINWRLTWSTRWRERSSIRTSSPEIPGASSLRSRATCAWNPAPERADGNHLPVPRPLSRAYAGPRPQAGGLLPGLFPALPGLHLTGNVAVRPVVRHGRVGEAVHEMEPWLRQCDGVTISGGEPFDQPEALMELTEAIRRLNPVDIFVFTGYSLEQINAYLKTHPGLIDALMSNPYQEGSSQTMALRGSDNQQLNLLTELGRARFASYDRPLRLDDKRLDLMMDERGERLWVAGIPKSEDLPCLRRILGTQGHKA